MLSRCVVPPRKKKTRSFSQTSLRGTQDNCIIIMQKRLQKRKNISLKARHHAGKPNTSASNLHIFPSCKMDYSIGWRRDGRGWWGLDRFWCEDRGDNVTGVRVAVTWNNRYCRPWNVSANRQNCLQRGTSTRWMDWDRRGEQSWVIMLASIKLL